MTKLLTPTASQPASRRDGLLAVLIVGVLLAAGFAANSGRSVAARLAMPDHAKPLPAGQTIRTGVLPAPARAFATPGTHGWTGHAAGWSQHGHHGVGSLVVSPRSRTGRLTASPRFAVTPEKRYSAGAWVRTAGSARETLALQFFDRQGRTIPSGTQIGQVATVRHHWRRLPVVVGFAPATAVRGRVVLVSDGPTGATLVDDVHVSQISGRAHRIEGPLTTAGNAILDKHGRRVVLRGVQIEGLQWLRGAPLSTLLNNVSVARAWGANFIRLPLNPDKLLVGSCAYQRGYLAQIDAVVHAITSAGMLAEIELAGFSVVPCGDPHLPPLPDQRGVAFWRELAGHYAGNPLVAFDLFNEPHDISDQAWLNGGLVNYGGIRYLAVGMNRLYQTVRATGAQNLVFVSGTRWATEPAALSPLHDVRNVVYAAHAYTCPTGLPSQGVQCPASQFGPGGKLDPTRILNRFNRIAAVAPVVVDEFGWPDDQDGRFTHNVISSVAKRGWSGWATFAFDGSTVGRFNLVRNIGTIENPMPSGISVMRGLFAN